MIIQYYRAGGSMVKVTIDNLTVIIFDANLARRGVSTDQILARDQEKMDEWKEFMKSEPTEREIADELEIDFKKSFGFVLASEVSK